MNAKKKSPTLGKGLGALLPSSSDSGIRQVELERIRPAENQPRLRFEEGPLEELADSIRTHGLLQPLVVRPGEEGDFVLIAGERRYHASKRAGLSAVPVVVKEVTGPGAYELSLVENLQRKDLDPVEEARAFQHLVDDLGYSHSQVAKRIGRSRAAVSNSLRLLELTADLLELVALGRLTVGHARALLPLQDLELQRSLAARVLDEELSVRVIERLVREHLERPKRSEPQRKEDILRPYFNQIASEATEKLDAPVAIRSRRRGAEIVIKVRTLGQLESILSGMGALTRPPENLPDEL